MRLRGLLTLAESIDKPFLNYLVSAVACYGNSFSLNSTFFGHEMESTSPKSAGEKRGKDVKGKESRRREKREERQGKREEGAKGGKGGRDKAGKS